MKKEYINIKKSVKPIWISWYVFSYLTTYVIYVLRKLNFSPDIFTYISLFFWFVTFYFILNTNFILAWIFIQITIIFDILDWQWARYKRKQSKYWALLDSIVDEIFISLIYIWLYIVFPSYWFELFLLLIISFVSEALSKNISIEDCKIYKWINLTSEFKKKVLWWNGNFKQYFSLIISKSLNYNDIMFIFLILSIFWYIQYWIYIEILRRWFWLWIIYIKFYFFYFKK